MSIPILVYGSLRKGLWGHQRFLSSYEALETKRISGFVMFSVNDEYPFIIHGNEEITVELYYIDAQKLQELDEFEGCPNQYTRETINLPNLQAFIYVYSKNNPEVFVDKPKVNNGDWVEYLKLAKD